MVSDKQLLESIAHDCINAIREKWSFVESAEVKIKKIHPDFNGLNLGAVAVQLNWKK
jgi:dihydroneopterin aldolase